MRKLTRKFIVLLVAAVMVLGTCMTAYAQSGGYTTTFTGTSTMATTMGNATFNGADMTYDSAEDETTVTIYTQIWT